jgi:hypothetical protein
MLQLSSNIIDGYDLVAGFTRGGITWAIDHEGIPEMLQTESLNRAGHGSDFPDEGYKRALREVVNAAWLVARDDRRFPSLELHKLFVLWTDLQRGGVE